MPYDFADARALLNLCEAHSLPVSGVMRRREAQATGQPLAALDARMAETLAIMREAAAQALEEPRPSMGGLLGGQAQHVQARCAAGQSLAGPVLGRAMACAMSVLEVNASMGLIVAAPTAGAAGVLPGVLLALQEANAWPDARVVDALWCASAVGYLAMRNATVAGAVGGCQAEVGVASAMAAAAAVEAAGGAPAQALDAAATALVNLLGLVCDPVGGLVEVPCQARNAGGAASALAAAELALAGAAVPIPLDEMLAAMLAVGRRLPVELRETALGGCAATPTACRLCGGAARRPAEA